LKRTFRVFFFIFFFLICVCIPWVWLGWRWCGGVLMYCSLFRNFTFVFIDFYFILACLYSFVLLVFFFRCLFQCLFVCLFISFIFPFSIYLLFMLCDYFIIFSLKIYLALKRDYHILFVYWLIVYVAFLKISRNILCII
jgi:hypothetical protein